MKNTKALSYALLCVLLWSFIAIVARMGQHRLDSFQFLFWSNSLSAISVFMASRIAGKSTKEVLCVPWRTIRQTALLGCLDGLFYLLLYRGYAIENGVAVLVAQYSWPLMIVGLAVLLFREHLSIRQIGGMCLGFMAVVVTLTHGYITRIAVTHPQALMLVFAGAFCFALLSVLSRRFSVDAYVGTFWLFVFSTGVSVVLLAAFSRFAWPSGMSSLALLLNGVLINGLSYILWVRAMAIGEASKIAPLVFISPILSIVWLVLIFGEPFVPAYALGVILAVASGLLCTGFGTMKKSL
ncbi:DMT family transporter [Dyella psychrodurans]|uniref:DMT family transporter n=1 Tax=Dyella psychrodurans TaxID=1927960 RepID=UPI0018F6F3F9|nr:DMT family transporter [Dyella psychrodurans]